MDYNVQGVGKITIDTVIFDLNGTLAVNGKLVEGVKDRIERLKNEGFRVYVVSTDHRGNGKELADDLGIEFIYAETTNDKEDFIREFDPEMVAAIGNARVDIGLFDYARISIATMQAEGIHAAIFRFVDIIVTSVNDAIDILLDKTTFENTMKK